MLIERLAFRVFELTCRAVNAYFTLIGCLLLVMLLAIESVSRRFSRS